MRDQTIIQFINHSSVIVDTGPVRLLCDPWLIGSVFHQGWDLLVEPEKPIDQLDFSHIWFSHEHPDHFSPADLRRLKEYGRQDIPVYFQQTRDGKVRDFCQSLGFPVTEMNEWQPYKLNRNISITNGTVGGFDSWLHMRTDSASILNLNDCRLSDPDALRHLKLQIGELDVLLTQFGYASWAGNDGDAYLPQRAARTNLDQVQAQIEILQPKAVIPFASFVWFSHEENYYWNRYSVKVDQITKQIEAKGTEAIVMYPGDTWNVGCLHDNSVALAKWENAYVAVEDRYLHESIPVPFPMLNVAFQSMQDGLRAKNDWGLIQNLQADGYLPASTIYLTDYRHAVSFDIVNGLHTSSVSPEECDIRLSSEGFERVLKLEWGRGTITINGRFQANYKTLWRFFRQTAIAYANNIGLSYPDSLSLVAITNPRTFILDILSAAD